MRDRREDILPLASWIGGRELCIDDDAKTALRAYDWPGNVRELQNTIKRAMLLGQSETIGIESLGIETATKLPPRVLDVDADDIVRALQQAEGVVSDAARILGLSRSAFYRRVKKFNIDLP